jgi:hypothetical protein
MANQAFSISALARCLTKSDFYNEQRLSDDEFRANVLEYALQLSQCDVSAEVSLSKVKIGEKTGYTAGNIASKLILRRCKNNIQTSCKIRLNNRQSISREIPIYLKEGTPYRVYRLDIKSFFENIPQKMIIESLEENQKLSSQTKRITTTILESFSKKHGNGIPRGIEFSPILSEMVLSNYDKKIHSHEDVFYYARFVDDILIITSSNEIERDFYTWLCDTLPPPLIYNHIKTKTYTIPRRKKAGAANPNGKLVAKFDFLGYSYSVYDTPLPNKPGGGENENTAGSIYREVIIDIEDRKIKKIKERISKAFFSFSKNADFDLLHDRLKFLTSNRELNKKDEDRKVPTGIYYNYASIEPHSGSLKKLDSFLAQSITRTTGRLGRVYAGKLSKPNRETLLKITFSKGFEKRAHRKFSLNRLKEITRIWL